MSKTNGTKYYIAANDGSDYWTATKATTLRGAKIVAERTYQCSVGGKMWVGEKIGTGDAERIERVAVKYGYDKWVQA